MTNRQAFMLKLIKLSDEDFANLFTSEIVQFIYDAKCKDCKDQQGGQCLMDINALENCPVDLAEWLKQQAI